MYGVFFHFNEGYNYGWSIFYHKSFVVELRESHDGIDFYR
jgi:hypothetical protein